MAEFFCYIFPNKKTYSICLFRNFFVSLVINIYELSFFHYMNAIFITWTLYLNHLRRWMSYFCRFLFKIPWKSLLHFIVAYKKMRSRRRYCFTWGASKLSLKCSAAGQSGEMVYFRVSSMITLIIILKFNSTL